ncbi:MAG: PQQ-binding-like beta-propeller repeat protein [Verrucomicrobiales bacterium]|nr:PQQ-binding-like beta-propeller repeat protein [Verrucomicrobiales bacterium]
MDLFRLSCALLFIFGVLSDSSFGEDWLQWRGPNGNGTAESTVAPPAIWDTKEGIKWKAAIPGRGHASPIVSRDLVVIATATDDAQFAIAYDRGDGSVRWKQRVHEGGVPTELHRKNTAASATPTSDGEHFFFLFHNAGRLVLSALDRSGDIVWRKDTGGFQCDYRFGYGPSPVLYKGSLIVVSEHGDGYIAAFDKTDGVEQWRVPRKNKTSYSSPALANVSGKVQLLLSGADKIVSYNPENGEILWETAGSSLATCGTMIWSEELVFASGGFPNKETLAVKADGSGEVLWKNGEKSYEQSMLYHDGFVYTLNDNGIALCWNAETGDEKWKVRLGGPVSASPILADGIVYATNERGITFAFKANPEVFEKVGQFRLGDEGFATPVFVGEEVFVRTADQGVERQEYLYCIGQR